MSFVSLSLSALFFIPAGGSPATEVLYTIERPAGATGGWLSTMVSLPDINGDGISDLALAPRTHGGGVARIFSGATGDQLFEIRQDFHVLFFGRGIAGVSDQTGDGVPEIVITGFRSGDGASPDGRIHVYSGADGSVVRELLAPAGVVLREGRILAMDDADGDGIEDILVRTHQGPGANQIELLSSVTGQPLHMANAAPDTGTLISEAVRTSDHDGDGHADFMIAVYLDGTNERVLQIRSGRTGQVLNVMNHPTLDVFTGNGEPLVSLADRDQDGLDDLAVGGVFEGLVATFSSTGELTGEWTTEAFGLGSLMINPGDLNGDGREDLITVDEVPGSDPADSLALLVGLDLETGDRIFSEIVVGIEPAYGSADVMIAMSGLDQGGAPTFVIIDPPRNTVSVRRFVFNGKPDSRRHQTKRASHLPGSGLAP